MIYTRISCLTRGEYCSDTKLWSCRLCESVDVRAVEYLATTAVCSVGCVCIYLREDSESAKVMIAMSVSMTAGLIMFIMSLFQLGFIVTYMSDPFVSGYIAAANILVSVVRSDVVFLGPLVLVDIRKPVSLFVRRLSIHKKFFLIFNKIW